MKIITIISKNTLFFVLYFLFAILSFYLLSSFQKLEGFIIINPYHSPILDKLFIFFTMLGNGWFMIIVAAMCFLFKRKNLAVLILSSFLLSGIIAQLLKFFIPEARPAIFLEKSNYHLFIENVTLHSWSSFPSGHTASAFAFAAILTFYYRNKWLAIPFFIYACLVGYSRIYIGDHFLVDVLSGSFIGNVSAVACFAWFYRKPGTDYLSS